MNLFQTQSDDYLSAEWLNHSPSLRKLMKSIEYWDTRERFMAENALASLWAAKHVSPIHTDLVILKNGQLFGLMTGHLWPSQKLYFIEYIAVAGKSTSEQHFYRMRLVREAIDCSQEHGFHGWVGCSPDRSDIRIWKDLGFCDHGDLIYRRMGYFLQ